MTTAILDYGSGNLRSAAKAFERAAAQSGLRETILVTSRPEEVAAAERIVLPGVGAFADCRRGLAAVPGLEAALKEAVIGRGRPFLGICVGMQLMADCGREFETVDGLGWVPGGGVAVERLTQYSGTDLDDLCEATESAIVEGGGFGWLKAPPRQVLENYWKGVLLVPERRLVVGRLDGVIAGSVQLSRAPRNNEAQG